MSWRGADEVRRRADVHRDRRSRCRCTPGTPGPRSRCGSTAGRAWSGSRRRRSTWRRRAAVRSISAAAAAGSHSGMIIIGMKRPGKSPASSSRMKSFQARTQASADLLVLRLVEDLAAVAGERGEQHRGEHVALVHVGDAGRGLVAALAHVVVGDRLGRELLARLAGDGVEPGRDDLAVLVDPELGVAVADDARRDVAPLRGHPLLPEPGRLDEVVVDGDEPVERHRDLHRPAAR